ncbi:MAG: molybdopterin molybdotransferase MoeA [Thermoleophilia bacterium]|nr:molybdopterin molybdotransferase MoeA [Thermoleophilia bacterium]
MTSAPARRIGLGEAIEAAARMAPPSPRAPVALAASAGRRLADAVAAVRDLPAGDAAAMDGWALRAGAAPGELVVVGESAAGRPFHGEVPAGGACRIATGALLPPGTDVVLRLEDGEDRGDRVLVPVPLAAGGDVRPRGSEVRAGTVVFPAGHVLRPHDVGVVAALGHAEVMCSRPVRVAILGSGDELVEAGTPEIPAWAVIDSNIPMLRAMVAAAGGDVVHVRRVNDTAGGLDAGLGAALGSGADVVITVGGASVGRHDHIRPALRRLGARAVADGLPVRPGHPVWLGVADPTPVLCLPGNPGAAMALFHTLGRPLLGAGAPWTPMPFLRDLPPRDDDDRLSRCHLTPDGLVPLDDQRPASVHAMGDCDALAWIPAGVRVASGDPVRASVL